MAVTKKGCARAAAIVLTVFLIAALGAAWYIDRRFEAIFPGAKVNHLDVTDLRPSLRVAIDPEPFSARITAMINEQSPVPIPAWLVNYVFPHGASIILDADQDTAEIRFQLLVNLRRLGPILQQNIYQAELPQRFPEEVRWDAEGMKAHARGVLTYGGAFPMDEAAREEVWYRWGRTLIQAPFPLEGGHALEALADNREGNAYLVMASLMSLYDYNLDEQEQDVSRTSLLFVTRARLTANVAGERAMRFRLTIDVVEEYKDRIAVVNLKAFLDDLFQRLAGDFDRYHGIPFAGASHWDGPVMIFEYELGDFPETINLVLAGRLFQP